MQTHADRRTHYSRMHPHIIYTHTHTHNSESDQLGEHRAAIAHGRSSTVRNWQSLGSKCCAWTPLDATPYSASREGREQHHYLGPRQLCFLSVARPMTSGKAWRRRSGTYSSPTEKQPPQRVWRAAVCRSCRLTVAAAVRWQQRRLRRRAVPPLGREFCGMCTQVTPKPFPNGVFEVTTRSILIMRDA